MTLFTDKAPRIMADLRRDFAPFSAEDAAAVLGNIGHECGGFKLWQEQKPTVEGSRGGFGWCQWTGPRRRAFEAWVAARGLNPKSDAANYGYLVVELRGSEKAAVPATRKAPTLDAKVVAFEMNFERAGVKHYPSRIKYAQQALAAYLATGPVPSPPDIATSDAHPSKPNLTKGQKAAGGTLATGGAAVLAAKQAGVPWWQIGIGAIVVAIVGLAAWAIYEARKRG